ncbi:MAG: 30S ribosomal protein S7 [Parcubacteria group bacterium]|nr:30S ribosomal protein S7 [Parcubacteria group bacterium]
MRRPVKKKKVLSPDFVYNSTKVEKFINHVMKRGQKETARGIVYGAFDIIKEKEKTENPLEVFDKAIKNVGPLVEVRSRRIGGANYMVPREVKADRRFALAMRWILEAARGRKGAPMREKLAEELTAASKGQGPAITKKENTHKMAEANKAFAHFSW